MAGEKKSTLGVELKHLARTYSHLFLRAADAFLIWDRHGIIRNANGAACLLTGYDSDEILGLDHRRLFPEDMHPLLDDILTRSVDEEDGTILLEEESEMKPKVGQTIPITLRFIAVRGPDDVSLLGLIHDIRDLKDLEARLALSQARYRGIVENVNEMIMLLDDSGSILFANYAAEHSFGRHRESLEGKDFRSLVTDEDLAKVEDILAGNLADTESADKHPSLRMRGDDGEVREYSLFINDIPDERNQPGGILVIMHDITGQRELQEKLQYAERVQSIENILSKITHEVKNPLAAINASAEFLRRHWEVPDEEKREVIELIAEETDRINRIISDYLRIRRIPRPTPLDYEIVDVVAQVKKSLDALLNGHPDIKLTLDVEDAEFAFDADMLKQVLWNLITNAVDAVSNSGEVRVSGNIVDSSYQLRVADSGCGMDKEMLKRAFDPFFTSKENGTGLGLALVKQHVDALEGEVTVESIPGEGTEFIITLPLKREEQL